MCGVFDISFESDTIYLYITKGVYSRIRLKESDMNNPYTSDLVHSPIVLVPISFHNGFPV